MDVLLGDHNSIEVHGEAEFVLISKAALEAMLRAAKEIERLADAQTGQDTHELDDIQTMAGRAVVTRHGRELVYAHEYTSVNGQPACDCGEWLLDRDNYAAHLVRVLADAGLLADSAPKRSRFDPAG